MNIAIKPAYLLLVSAIAFASCSQDDTPGRTDGNDNRIVFRTSIPELTSRAKIVREEKDLPYFHVTAFDLEDRESIGDDGVMKTLFAEEAVIVDKNIYTSPDCCWPGQTKESHQVSFFGFYPGLAEVKGARLVNESTATAIDYKLTDFRVAADIAKQSDFITAYATGNMADDLFKGITLPFVHQLSRIEIKAYGKHKSCDIEIAGVRIGGTGVKGTFEFKPVVGAGEWSGTPERDTVEYVYCTGDKIFTCGKNHHVAKEDAVSIMGSKHGDDDNCAMLIPSEYAPWESAKDRCNDKNQMYISVLLRVTDATLDATPDAGEKPVEIQRYPYKDLSHGDDALKLPIVYLAVKKASGEVSTRLYKNDEGYFTDSTFTTGYVHPDTEEIKEFGWAALPVAGTWAPGKVYIYTLDYTHGVGLHDPRVSTTAPGPGDPVISDKVGITYTVKEWEVGGGSEVEVPGS